MIIMHKLPGKIFRVAKAVKSPKQNEDFPITECKNCEEIINSNCNFCKHCGQKLD